MILVLLKVVNLIDWYEANPRYGIQLTHSFLRVSLAIVVWSYEALLKTSKNITEGCLLGYG